MDTLAVLQEMERIRKKAEKQPKSYPPDYTIRLCEAIVAKASGYKSRNEWTLEVYKGTASA